MSAEPLDVAQPAGRFLRSLFAISAAALAVGLMLYVALRPGAGAMLAQGGWPAARLLLRQVLVNGLPVVMATTWIGAVMHSAWRSGGAARGPGLILFLADPVIRLAVFAALHAAIFVLAADWFGSFGGQKATALRVVAPTLARAAVMENLSGVYLYAALAVALPAQAEAARRIAPRVFGAGRVAAFLLAMMWTAAAVTVFTWLAAAVAAS